MDKRLPRDCLGRLEGEDEQEGTVPGESEVRFAPKADSKIVAF